MNRRLVLASVLLFVATVLRAAPPGTSPDFWYVVPDVAHAAPATRVVNGIVIPSSVDPTVATSPSGSVLSWRRPDGTRQSFAVQGITSFTFKPGPLKGTTYVPFGRAKAMQRIWGMCCSCASWQNSVESFELLTCVPGCQGCGCEGCICSDDSPCPTSPLAAWTLVAHDDPSAIMTIGKSGPATDVTIAATGRPAVKLRGRALSTRVNSEGNTEIENPESIAMPGKVTFRSAVRGDKAFFAWSSSELSVIAEQPRSFAPPSFRDGNVELGAGRDGAGQRAASPIAMAPVSFRCSVCGTHPNSDADTDAMECVPGSSTCLRCISFECVAPQS